MELNIAENKKIYFASDNHLGAPNPKESKIREAKFVSWLNTIKKDAGAIFLLGDLFDFWFEYKTVVPKGFVRVLGKLAEIRDSGIPIFFFVGNHDLWMNGYFEEELNIPVFHKPKDFTINGTSFFIGHGDGLGPNDIGFKLMKKVFINPFCKWLFKWIHPDIGVQLAQKLSIKNKLISGDADTDFLGEDNEWLVQYCKRKLTQKHRDFFVFGHRHLPMQIKLKENASYTNLGDWCNYFTYATFEEKEMRIHKYEE